VIVAVEGGAIVAVEGGAIVAVEGGAIVAVGGGAIVAVGGGAIVAVEGGVRVPAGAHSHSKGSCTMRSGSTGRDVYPPTRASMCSWGPG
jgi:hypothetical protein